MLHSNNSSNYDYFALNGYSLTKIFIGMVSAV